MQSGAFLYIINRRIRVYLLTVHVDVAEVDVKTRKTDFFKKYVAIDK